MNLRIMAGIAAVGLGVIGNQAQETTPFKDQKSKASYGIGLNIGASLKQQGLQLDLNALSQGVKDALSGAKRQLSEEEIRAALSALQAEMANKGQELAAANKVEGEAYLKANGSKEGVQSLPSGLQYKITKAGAGAKPSATDTVRTHYRGTLIDGTEFDSSYTDGEPVTFPVNGVIPGWTEALQLMPVGSKWQLYVPSNLAYGERGHGPIPPNATLIFDVELLGIEAKQ